MGSYSDRPTASQIVSGFLAHTMLKQGLKVIRPRSRRPQLPLKHTAIPVTNLPTPVPLPPPPPPPTFTLPDITILGSSTPPQPTVAGSDFKMVSGQAHILPHFSLLVAAAAVLLCIASATAQWRKARGANNTPATPPSGSHRPPRSPSFTPLPRHGSPTRYPPTPHPYPGQRRHGGGDNGEGGDDNNEEEPFDDEDPFGGDDHQEVVDEDEKEINEQTASREEPLPPPPPPPAIAKGSDPNPFHHLPIWWLLLFLFATAGLVLLGLAEIFPGVKTHLQRVLRAFCAPDTDSAKVRAVLKYSARVIGQELVAGGGREGTRVQRAATADNEAMALVVGFVAVAGLIMAGGMVARGGRERAVELPTRVQAAQSAADAAITRLGHPNGFVTRPHNTLSNASSETTLRDESNRTLATLAKLSALPARMKKVWREASTLALPPSPTPASTQMRVHSRSQAVQSVATSAPAWTPTLISTRSQTIQTTNPSSTPVSTQTQTSTMSQATQTQITTRSCSTQTPTPTSVLAVTQTEGTASTSIAIQTLSPGTMISTSTQTQGTPPRYSSIFMQTDTVQPPPVKVYINSSAQASHLDAPCTVVESSAQTPSPTENNPIKVCTTIATQTDPVAVVVLQTDAPDTDAATQLSPAPTQEPSLSSNPAVFGMTIQEEIDFDFAAFWGDKYGEASRSDAGSEYRMVPFGLGDESVWFLAFESSAFREVNALTSTTEPCDELSGIREDSRLEMIEASVLEIPRVSTLQTEAVVEITEEVLPDVVDLEILKSPLREPTSAGEFNATIEMSIVEVLEARAGPGSATPALEDDVFEEAKDLSIPAGPLESELESTVLLRAEPASYAEGPDIVTPKAPESSNVRPSLDASRPPPGDDGRFLGPFTLPYIQLDSICDATWNLDDPAVDLCEVSFSYCHPAFRDRVEKKLQAQGKWQTRQRKREERRLAEQERQYQARQADKRARNEQERLQRKVKEERDKLAMDNRRLEEELKVLREDDTRRWTQADEEERAIGEREITRLKAELLLWEEENKLLQDIEILQLEEAWDAQETEHILREQLQEEARARTAVLQAEEANERVQEEHRQIEFVKSLRTEEERRVQEIEHRLDCVRSQLQDEWHRQARERKEARTKVASYCAENKKYIKERAFYERRLQEERKNTRQMETRLLLQQEEHTQLVESVKNLRTHLQQGQQRLEEEREVRKKQESELQLQQEKYTQLQENTKALQEHLNQEQQQVEKEQEGKKSKEMQLQLQRKENMRLQEVVQDLKVREAQVHAQRQEKEQEECNRLDRVVLLRRDEQNKQLTDEIASLKEEMAQKVKDLATYDLPKEQEKQQAQEQSRLQPARHRERAADPSNDARILREGRNCLKAVYIPGTTRRSKESMQSAIGQEAMNSPEASAARKAEFQRIRGQSSSPLSSPPLSLSGPSK